MVAPAYIEDTYVDHELSANLDSTFAFEGPEKLLEIWLWPDTDHLNGSEGLRAIPLEKWQSILDLVSCKILSMKSSNYMDAYLLSESSLFVFPHKLILKTCGTTTTLFCIDKLFETIQKYVNQKITTKEIFKIFYSRRSFMFPDKQVGVHKDWKNEVKLLSDYFENGKSYVVGNFTSDDHWYLYMGGHGSDDKCSLVKDQTFEVLMTDLDPVQAEQFVTSRKPGFESLVQNGSEESDLGHDIGMETLESSGLGSLLEENLIDSCNSLTLLPSPKDEETFKEPFSFIHDAFSFTPCGYSSNSLSSNHGGYYYTLHITPENGWSYASFETNYPFNNSKLEITNVLIKILKIFNPGKFSVTLISETENYGFLGRELDSLFHCDSKLAKLNYVKNERVLYDLNNYKLLYLHFQRP